jgi:hypothetical protein
VAARLAVGFGYVAIETPCVELNVIEEAIPTQTRTENDVESCNSTSYRGKRSIGFGVRRRRGWWKYLVTGFGANHSIDACRKRNTDSGPEVLVPE